MPAPVNDLFADAAAIDPAGDTVQGTTIDASRETDEPSDWVVGPSAWWKFTPVDDVTLTFTTDEPAAGTWLLNIALAIYTGATVDALTLIAGTDAGGDGLVAPLEFDYLGGVAYFVQVGGWDTSEGAFALTVAPVVVSPPTEPVDNDLSAAGALNVTGWADVDYDVPVPADPIVPSRATTGRIHVTP